MKSTRSLKLTLAYDGSAYAGWQLQSDQPSIQGQVEAAWQKVVGNPVRVTASGRTDAGVHALGQVASCQINSELSTDVLQRALNANLPVDIRVLDVTDAPPGFHAIRDAVSKRYRYTVQAGGVADPFQRAYCWYLPQPLDVDSMRRVAGRLCGTHDFRCFQAAGSPRQSTIRTVTDLTVTSGRGPLSSQVIMEIEADGFLYNMVRNVMGTLIQIGKGQHDESWIDAVLASHDRRWAGPTAPARGLCLLYVRYAP